MRPVSILLLKINARTQGSKQKPKHYLSLALKAGRLQLVVRGRRRRALSGVGVTPGVWQGVSVRVGGGRVMLGGGAGGSGGTASVARAPRRLGLGARLYVGGLPERTTLPNLPDSVSHIRLRSERYHRKSLAVKKASLATMILAISVLRTGGSRWRVLRLREARDA